MAASAHWASRREPAAKGGPHQALSSQVTSGLHLHPHPTLPWRRGRGGRAEEEALALSRGHHPLTEGVRLYLQLFTLSANHAQSGRPWSSHTAMRRVDAEDSKNWPAASSTSAVKRGQWQQFCPPWAELRSALAMTPSLSQNKETPLVPPGNKMLVLIYSIFLYKLSQSSKKWKGKIILDPFIRWESERKLLSRVQLFATLWTVAYQAPPSMGFSRQEYWNELPFPSPGDLPYPGIKPGSPTLQADAFPSEPPGKPYQMRKYTQTQVYLSYIQIYITHVHRNTHAHQLQGTSCMSGTARSSHHMSQLHACRWYCCPHCTDEESEALRGRRSMCASHGAGSQRRVSQTWNPCCPLLLGQQRDNGSSRLGAEAHTSPTLPLCLLRKSSASTMRELTSRGADLRGPPQRRPGAAQPAFSAVEWSHELLLPSVAWIIIKCFLGYTCLF